MCKRKGFTLIELLVVISIIALLMAILIPALRSAKRVATGAVCLGNLHALAMAWFTYTLENDGHLVPGDVLGSGYSAADRGTNWVDPPVFITGTYAGNSGRCTIRDKKRGCEWGALFPFSQDVDIYHCPGDPRCKRPPTTITRPTAQGGWRTYSLPDALNAAPGQTYNCTIFAQIKNPADKYNFIEENDTRGYNRGSWAFEDVDDPMNWDWVDPFAVFHGKKSTLGWCDGHAEMHMWRDKRTLAGAAHRDWRHWQDIRDNQRGNVDLVWMKDHMPHVGIWK